jgi:DNA-directed RNA polymerase subunit alpha
MSSSHQADAAIPIEDLDLSVRAYNCLKREGIERLGDLLGWSQEDLLAIRNFGMKQVREIEDKLRKLGFGGLGRGRPSSGSREPRKPKPSAGAGAAAAPLPETNDQDTA